MRRDSFKPQNIPTDEIYTPKKKKSTRGDILGFGKNQIGNTLSTRF
jgi:hypothetical protein